MVAAALLFPGVRQTMYATNVEINVLGLGLFCTFSGSGDSCTGTQLLDCFLLSISLGVAGNRMVRFRNVFHVEYLSIFSFLFFWGGEAGVFTT